MAARLIKWITLFKFYKSNKINNFSFASNFGISGAINSKIIMKMRNVNLSGRGRAISDYFVDINIVPLQLCDVYYSVHRGLSIVLTEKSTYNDVTFDIKLINFTSRAKIMSWAPHAPHLSVIYLLDVFYSLGCLDCINMLKPAPLIIIRKRYHFVFNLK